MTVDEFMVEEVFRKDLKRKVGSSKRGSNLERTRQREERDRTHPKSRDVWYSRCGYPGLDSHHQGTKTKATSCQTPLSHHVKDV